MRRSSILDINKEKKKYQGFSEKKEKMKSQSEIEKELNIRSYSEYRIKDDDSMIDYEEEDIEAKMIRLIILKKKGGNIKENIYIPKKKYEQKLKKIKEALIKLEKIDNKRKIKKFIIKFKAQSISLHLRKRTLLFFQKIKKYIYKLYLKKKISNFITSFQYYQSIYQKK